MAEFKGYLRSDGRKGIRNVVAVAYLVECSKFVANRIVAPFEIDPATEGRVHEIGFPGCYPNAHAEKILSQLATHPNVGAVLLVSLGCESMNRERIEKLVLESGRPAASIGIQEVGGTEKAIALGREWVADVLKEIDNVPMVPMSVSDLSVATICGGSDGTSGVTANPAVGVAFDKLVDAGATCVFEETGELIGCETDMASRAINDDVAKALVSSVEKRQDSIKCLDTRVSLRVMRTAGCRLSRKNHSVLITKVVPAKFRGLLLRVTCHLIPAFG